MLAGPVEFSTADILVALLLLLVFFIVLPLLGGYVSLRLYRRRTPRDAQTRRDSVMWFLIGGTATFAAELFISWVGEAIV